jgi:hypothetical protein
MALLLRRAVRLQTRTLLPASALHAPSSSSREPDHAALSPAARVLALRHFHSSAPRDSALILGGLGLAGAALGAKYVYQVLIWLHATS